MVNINYESDSVQELINDIDMFDQYNGNLDICSY